tara:strand:+ start:219 stop:389 length:171 start_codon:yes stop_codon:yes gene_type:complete
MNDTEVIQKQPKIRVMAQANSLEEDAELLNGRLAMMGVVAALGSYIVTGQLIPNIW